MQLFSTYLKAFLQLFANIHGANLQLFAHIYNSFRQLLATFPEARSAKHSDSTAG